MTPIIPDIPRTERLTLRTPVESDLEPMVAFYASERSAMAMGPLPRDKAFTGFCVEVAHWHQKGFGNYTITLGGTSIGQCGTWQPKGWDQCEIGWLLWDGYEGHGDANEAGRAVLEMVESKGWETSVSYATTDTLPSDVVATGRVDLSGLWAGIRPQNARSRRLADRLGLASMGETRDHDELIYRRAAA